MGLTIRPKLKAEKRKWIAEKKARKQWWRVSEWQREQVQQRGRPHVGGGAVCHWRWLPLSPGRLLLGLLTRFCCVWLCEHVDRNLPGSSVRVVFLARILEWVATSSARGSSQPRDRTPISCIADGFFTTEPWGNPCHSGLLPPKLAYIDLA